MYVSSSAWVSGNYVESLRPCPASCADLYQLPLITKLLKIAIFNGVLHDGNLKGISGDMWW